MIFTYKNHGHTQNIWSYLLLIYYKYRYVIMLKKYII